MWVWGGRGGSLIERENLRKYNITFSELPTIPEIAFLSPETLETNRFLRFKEAFQKQKSIIVGNVTT